MECHIIMTLFLEITMFGEGILVLPLKKRVFLSAYVPQILYIYFDVDRDVTYF